MRQPFGDFMKFRAKSSEREGNAWVLGWTRGTLKLVVEHKSVSRGDNVLFCVF